MKNKVYAIYFKYSDGIHNNHKNAKINNKDIFGIISRRWRKSMMKVCVNEILE